MHIPTARVHHKSALEMGGNAFDAAEGDEEQADHTAIAVTIVEHILRDILYR